MNKTKIKNTKIKQNVKADNEVVFKGKITLKKKLLNNNQNLVSGKLNSKMINKPKTKKQKSSEIDFDPFEIYPNNLEQNKPILLVDLGYTTFYRFNATKTWYTHSHPEEKEDIKAGNIEWGDNKEFMKMFEQKYIDKILEIAKLYRVPRHNIILAQDCKSCDNWRSKIYSEYKLQRKLEKEEKGFDGTKVFKHAFQYTFKSMAKNYGFKLITHKEIEADDINAIITQYYQKYFPKVDVHILASDKDYLQLGNGKLHLVDFTGKLINDKKKDPKLIDGEYQLWHKLLIGDKSDNIPPVKIKRKYIRPNAKSGLDTYINITKKDGELLASDLKKFMKNLEDDPEMIKQSQLNFNRELIDFNMIPGKYRKTILKILVGYL